MNMIGTEIVSHAFTFTHILTNTRAVVVKIIYIVEPTKLNDTSMDSAHKVRVIQRILILCRAMSLRMQTNIILLL